MLTVLLLVPEVLTSPPSTSFTAPRRARLGLYLEGRQRRTPKIVELREPVVMDSCKGCERKSIALLAANALSCDKLCFSKHP